MDGFCIEVLQDTERQATEELIRIVPHVDCTSHIEWFITASQIHILAAIRSANTKNTILLHYIRIFCASRCVHVSTCATDVV